MRGCKMRGMKINRFVLTLTALNVLSMLAFWSQMQVARAQVVPDMLRATGLEMLTGDPARQEWSGIQVLAKPRGSTLRLLNLDGKERVIKPE